MNCPRCNEFIPFMARSCPACGESVRQSSDSFQDVMFKRENVLTGIVGALLGAVLGGASIVLLERLGFLAFISGLILAVCTLKGYELLGGRLSITGIIISIALMLVTPYIADRVYLTFLILEELNIPDLTFFDVFPVIPQLIGNGIETAVYIKDLVMLYIFVALGAFGTIRTAFQNQ